MPNNLIASNKISNSTTQLGVNGQSDDYYRQVLDGMPTAVYTCNAQGYIMMYNRAAAELWGREPEIGKDLWCGSWKIYRPDGTPLLIDACPMAIALKEGRAVKGEEIVIERPDGVRHNVLPHPQPIFDGAGQVIGAVNMLVDITGHRQDQQALSESEERFRTLADHAPIMIWMTDRNGRVVYFNSKWYDFTGAPIENGHKLGWTHFIHPEDKEKGYCDWKRAFQDRQTYDCIFRYKNATGEYSTVMANASPRMSERGQFMGYIGILNDITLQENAKLILEKRVDERTTDLLQANKELERSNLELEQFAYVASHDLQEPLRKIQAFSTLLQKNMESKFDEDSVRHLNKITGSANRLSLLIEDILNFSRLSRSNELLVETDLNEIFNKVKSDFEYQITQKLAIIKNDILPTIGAIPLQMNQLFHNLLGNALKFSSGERQPIVEISCKKLTPEEVSKHSELQKDIPYYEIVFKDNGIGFDQYYAEQIFLIFKRLNGQYLYPGSGIGLALCRKIIVNHHGKIFATGQEDKGSSFFLILPQSQTSR